MHTQGEQGRVFRLSQKTIRDEGEEGMRSTTYRALEVMVWVLDFIPRITEAENREEKTSHLYCRNINLDRTDWEEESRRAVRRLLKNLEGRNDDLNKCRAV